MLDELIEYTTRNIFLTGKAGTGKTTFLNQFIKKTKKKFIVTAPTGIAAINAGGVTIHSFFTFPLNNFIPGYENIDVNEALNRTQLLPHLLYRTDKKKLIRELELLIIDEVSMLRADLLDAIDFALRTVRQNPAPFGGVQLLLIGDLYQLPPIVRYGKHILDQYYPSPFFFDAKVLEEKPLITYQLEKIYRQTDSQFIQLLNQIRAGNITEQDLKLLDSRFVPNFNDQDEGYIYLVSHNQMAEQINQEKLAQIHQKSYYFDADVNGDFKNHQYPNEAKLELKVGAQIMFIRNDSSPNKAYYNGKIAEIVKLSSDEIYVRSKDSEEVIKVNKEIWENKKYLLDKNTQEIKQEVMGSFEQFPVKAAWAVTIHKSQGLTFDKVIIDAGKAFASGQVYVALSRCTNLEGIILKSRIQKHNIFTDTRVQSFQSTTEANSKIESIVETDRYRYALYKIKEILNFRFLYEELLTWQKMVRHQKKFEAAPILTLIDNALAKIKEWEKVCEKFVQYLERQFELYRHFKNNWESIVTKSENAVEYFVNQLLDYIVLPVIEHSRMVKGQKGLKGYMELVKRVLEQCQTQLNHLKNAYLFDHQLYTIAAELPQTDTKKIEKLNSDELSLDLFQQGKSIDQIALIRDIKPDTVFNHLSKAVLDSKISIHELITHEKTELFEKMKKSSTKKTLKEWKQHLPPDFEYNEIRLLVNYYK